MWKFLFSAWHRRPWQQQRQSRDEVYLDLERWFRYSRDNERRAFNTSSTSVTVERWRELEQVTQYVQDFIDINKRDLVRDTSFFIALLFFSSHFVARLEFVL